ncbi:cobalt transporter [Pseudanabaena galeata UHCC 0370]|uniref:Cobalt transporter n=1 Tax=Pseudanabaena galeata UHCC 0370 TaxID=3110310 RepID=A0ABU5TJS8_9CYAN|nr:cobalt transporter [Pseudanabaena galeata]MEA5478585.1 cobalt transporter [Pseudanabaena galeata UHCC 0370]
MKKFSLFSSIFSPLLAAALTLSTTAIAFAHVGHGDEFQATGGIERVKVNAPTDKQLGIEVKAIAPEVVSGKAVLIPMTALVDVDGKQLVFVQYENFYEPVPVKTGSSKGDLIEITEGLSVGEKLVTQGSLTLYAESRKTKPTNTAASPSAAPITKTDATVTNTSANNTPANNTTANNTAASNSTEGEFPIMQASIVGGGALLVATGVIAFTATRGKGKKGDS